ncbi:hypothetical protein SBF1_9540003 [Candidatus Desulfosporosinus infrequens]|uniref:Uncharacterized protein n=1 Tax=Candidatus Desulfosporosinus infrequens TaxID=2043169 RepID=A0A2U3LYP7_9FIRM|nr:hypothetical protein SBF1_9540003 [Candidatus Desulfosporosinus infrequens]
MDVLEYCITLLEPRLSEVITDMFINKMPWAELCDKYYVSQPMLCKYRRKAIEKLAKMLDGKTGGLELVK